MLEKKPEVTYRLHRDGNITEDLAYVNYEDKGVAVGAIVEIFVPESGSYVYKVAERFYPYQAFTYIQKVV